MRRQTSTSGINPAGSSRALRLDPLSLPVRFDAHDSRADGGVRHIELHRERVVLRRALHGMQMAVNVRVSRFSRRRAARPRRCPDAGAGASRSVLDDPALRQFRRARRSPPPGRCGATSSRCRNCRKTSRANRRHAAPASQRDPGAASEIPGAAARRRPAQPGQPPSGRARDHRAGLAPRDEKLARPHHRVGQQPANNSSPASRLDLKIRRHSAGSPISSRLICQTRCAANAASPIHAGQPRRQAPAPRRSTPPPARRTRPAPARVRAPNSSAVDLIPISASSSAS